jgi:uncharacterized protein (DUF1778 family)
MPFALRARRNSRQAHVTHPKSERSDVRVSGPVKPLLQGGVRVTPQNVNEFLPDEGSDAANQTLADRVGFDLNPEKWSQFQAALDQPVSVKPKLHKLLREESRGCD